MSKKVEYEVGQEGDSFFLHHYEEDKLKSIEKVDGINSGKEYHKAKLKCIDTEEVAQEMKQASKCCKDVDSDEVTIFGKLYKPVVAYDCIEDVYKGKNFNNTVKDLRTMEEKAMEALEKAQKEVDMVNHPPHYTNHPSGVECITITQHMLFNIGNAIKYLWRADEKGNAIEDLEKALWYVKQEIERRSL